MNRGKSFGNHHPLILQGFQERSCPFFYRQGIVPGNGGKIENPVGSRVTIIFYVNIAKRIHIENLGQFFYFLRNIRGHFGRPSSLKPGFHGDDNICLQGLIQPDNYRAAETLHHNNNTNHHSHGHSQGRYCHRIPSPVAKKWIGSQTGTGPETGKEFWQWFLQKSQQGKHEGWHP